MIRLDHTSRIPARAINELARAIQVTNCLRSQGLTGDGQSVPVLASLHQGPWHLEEHFVTHPNAPAGSNYTLRRRDAVPVPTIRTMTHVAIANRVSELKWIGRGGFRQWGFGHDGIDTTNTAAEDFLLLNSVNPLQGYSLGYYVDDYYAPVAQPVSPTYPANLQVGHPSAPTWQSWSDPKSPLLLQLPGNSNFPYGFSPMNPSGIGWNIGRYRNEGHYQCYPETQASPPIVFNTNIISGGITYNGVEPASASYDTRLQINMQAIGLPHILQALPHGSTIHSCRTRFRLESWAAQTVEFVNTFNPATLSINQEATSSPLPPFNSYALIQRTTANGRWRYSPVGPSIPAGDDPGKWSVQDITALANDILTNYRRNTADQLYLIPAPFAALLPGTDLRGFLRSIMPTIEYTVWQHPTAQQPPWAPVSVFIEGADQLYQSYGKGLSYLSWGGLQTDEIEVQFTYPSGLLGSAMIPGNLPRMDTLPG